MTSINYEGRTMTLLTRLPEIRGQYRERADLSKINWFRVGGPAEVLFKPADEADLQHFLKEKPVGVPVTVLGVGSNLLVRDGGLDGVVIRLGKGFADITVEGQQIKAGAGALVANVARVAQQHGLAGLEFLCGIPGTVGGALAMNAGAYGREVKDCLLSAQAINAQGAVQEFSSQDMGFTYRANALPEDTLFTGAIFKGEAQDKQAIAAAMERIMQEREASQPVRGQTSGSTFTNPPGKKAWQLIDEAGCRGLQIGGAQVSEKHCNFFINTGNATAADIEALGEEVRRRVKEKTGVELEWEVKREGSGLKTASPLEGGGKKS